MYEERKNSKDYGSYHLLTVAALFVFRTGYRTRRFHRLAGAESVEGDRSGCPEG
jgi:hypothetical protein